MGDFKITPGPWEIGFFERCKVFGKEGLSFVASTTKQKDNPQGTEEEAANAILIAAAPDLQESLLECAEVLEILASVLGTQTHGAALKSDAEDYGACRALERARIAINKSLGREE